MIIPASEDTMESWIQSFMSLRRNQFLFLQVISNLPADQNLAELLERFKSHWAEDDLWVNNDNDLKQAIVGCGLWIHKKLPDGDNFIKRHFLHDFIPVDEMEGHNIGIATGKGRSILRWKRKYGTAASRHLSSKISIPQHPEDLRAVSFTAEGIDVVDASGNAFRLTGRSGVSYKATIPRETFSSLESGRVFESCGLRYWTTWEYQSQL